MTTPEEILAAWMRTRRETDFRLLYRSCTPRLMGFSLRLTAGDAAEAEELVQEAWVRAVGRLAEFRPDGSLGRWLNGILVNCWRESRRRTVRNGVSHSHEVRQIAATGQRDHLDDIELRHAIDSLPEGFRAVLLLHDVEGFTHEEIGGLLGIAAGTSKSQLARARRAMRERLHTHAAEREV